MSSSVLLCILLGFSDYIMELYIQTRTMVFGARVTLKKVQMISIRLDLVCLFMLESVIELVGLAGFFFVLISSDVFLYIRMKDINKKIVVGEMLPYLRVFGFFSPGILCL